MVPERVRLSGISATRTALSEEARVSLNKPTPEQILAAADRELGLIIKRLVICRNRLYRESGTYPDDLGAAIQRAEFLLRDLMSGLITPVKAPAAKLTGAKSLSDQIH
jgi:hypothetical protein